MRADWWFSRTRGSHGGQTGIACALVLCALVGAAGCRKAHFVSGTTPDGGKRDGNASDGPSTDVALPKTCSADTPTRSKGKAEPCSCDRECQTGFCADGICCTSACGENCKSCNLRSSLGDCAFIPSGVRPNDPSTCLADTAGSCGLDGTCDGTGRCRQYVKGTECKRGTCEGDGVSGIKTCDGAGSCSEVVSLACPPYTCDQNTNRCAFMCTTNAECAGQQLCVNGRCGKSANGAVCETADDCASGFCADKVCCNVECAGACVSCNQTGSGGHCTFIPAGLPDPDCKASDQSTCGTTGLCDGFGSCSLWSRDTPCGLSSCSGLLENAPPTCDGQGTCRDPQLVDCSPFLCTSGVCEDICQDDSQCAPGYHCVLQTKNGVTSGLCGKRKNGQPCLDADECESGQCVDGVCCESSCTGPCRSCSLPSAPGQCLNVASNVPDPHKTCVDQGNHTCLTNGLCDGQGSCQNYAAGTLCKPESCVDGLYTAPFTCDASGQCVFSGSRDCNPYVCNGSTCFDICTNNDQCMTGKYCANSSCGLKPAGANCSVGTDCQTGFCAQGVCCDRACTDACVACNLATTAGTCTAVPDNSPDPQGKCLATKTETCGTTGKCAGGACAYVAKGQHCKDATCVGSLSFTPTSTCDGNGACSTPANQPCSVSVCASGACKITCTSSADCIPPALCVGNSCGLKDKGVACTAGSQCSSGFCTEGVCCDNACSDSCKTCKGTASNQVGTCSNVDSGGADPKASCQPESCKDNFHTPAAKCDGSGHCQQVTGTACATGYSCGVQTCQQNPGTGGAGGGAGGAGGSTGGTGGTHAGGIVATGGTYTGGIVATGGTRTGGIVVTGGAGSGGIVVTGGVSSGGIVVTGGISSGGIVVTGGISTGGVVMTGGISSGGIVVTGGTSTGGIVDTGGTITGGIVVTGGISTGGTVDTGGTITGGIVVTGGISTGGIVVTGGTITGGIVETGGISTGGIVDTGGISTGGIVDTGGISTGGIVDTGGTSTGGIVDTGGTSSGGGSMATGGSGDTGGGAGDNGGTGGGGSTDSTTGTSHQLFFRPAAEAVWKWL